MKIIKIYSHQDWRKMREKYNGQRALSKDKSLRCNLCTILLFCCSRKWYLQGLYNGEVLVALFNTFHSNCYAQQYLQRVISCKIYFCYIKPRLVPDGSYIAMDQFSNPREMADHLHFLMDNPDAYLKYFEWRNKKWSIAPWNHKDFLIGFLKI